jgi:SAM-dependent methyltransferase
MPGTGTAVAEAATWRSSGPGTCEHDVVAQDLNLVRDAVAAAPLAPERHAALAEAHMARGRAVTAAALLRTAAMLAGDDPTLGLQAAACVLAAGHVTVAERMVTALPVDLPGGLAAGVDALTEMAAEREDRSPDSLDPDRHQTLCALADHLTALTKGESFSLLDVGGGDGSLGLFLPESRYALADQSVNGLSPLALPFGENSFDIVCACHTLEQVATEDRVAFLDQLQVCARRHLVLLSTFVGVGARHQERRDLLADLFGDRETCEQPGCRLPESKLVESFAAERGLVCRWVPVGALPTAFALDLAARYARLAERAHELPRIHAFLNQWSLAALTNDTLPAAQLVTLTREEPVG